MPHGGKIRGPMLNTDASAERLPGSAGDLQIGWPPGANGRTPSRRFVDRPRMSIVAPENFYLDRLDTPIGIALLVTDADGCLRALDWHDYEPRMMQLLRRQNGAFSLAERAAPRDIRRPLSAYFRGSLDRLAAIKWRVGGTPFQRSVWGALQTVRAGSTMSYGAFAARLNVPKAVRAVGHANGANPISVVIPCHRLIGADGSLTGYGGGIARKRWLLAHEGVQLED